MTKKKIKVYGDVLKELWAKYKGKKPYKEVQEMAGKVISDQVKATKKAKEKAEGRKITRAKAKKEKKEKEFAGGGKTFSRGFRKMGEYS